MFWSFFGLNLLPLAPSPPPSHSSYSCPGGTLLLDDIHPGIWAKLFQLSGPVHCWAQTTKPRYVPTSAPPQHRDTQETLAVLDRLDLDTEKPTDEETAKKWAVEGKKDLFEFVPPSGLWPVFRLSETFSVNQFTFSELFQGLVEQNNPKYKYKLF